MMYTAPYRAPLLWGLWIKHTHRGKHAHIWSIQYACTPSSIMYYSVSLARAWVHFPSSCTFLTMVASKYTFTWSSIRLITISCYTVAPTDWNHIYSYLNFKVVLFKRTVFYIIWKGKTKRCLGKCLFLSAIWRGVSVSVFDRQQMTGWASLPVRRMRDTKETDLFQ